MSDKSQNYDDILPLTADIVASYVSNNTVPVADLGTIIHQVYSTLSSLGQPVARPEERRQPAVAIKKSIMPDYLICLEDGKKLKMLKRHLKTRYNMSPEDYRERWGLPADYPMVAPAYATQRRTLAKQIGLGRSRRRMK